MALSTLRRMVSRWVRRERMRVAMVSIYGVLDRYFMNNPRVAVHANMFMYYVQGDPKRNVCPDAFVAMGVPNEPDRRSYKVWKEGKAPDVVFEVTSRKTRKQDLTKKFEIYRDVLRVREYFLFDPFEEYLDPSLQGYRLVAGSYEPIPMIKGGMPSEVLGLELQRDGENLRFFNPETGKLLPSMHELAREVDLVRREAEVARREAEVARRRRKWQGSRRKLPGSRLRNMSSVCSEKSKSCVGDCPRSKNEARRSRSLAWNCTGCEDALPRRHSQVGRCWRCGTGLDGCDRFYGHEKSRETNFCPPRPNAWKGLRLTPHDAPAGEQGRRNVRLLGDTEQLVDGRGLPARRKSARRHADGRDEVRVRRGRAACRAAVTRERRPGLRVEGPHVEAVGDVVDGGQAQDPADVRHGQAEGRALGRIDGELAHELDPWA